MTYEELEEVVNNIFASRAKSVTGKIVGVWVKEIGLRGFYDQTIKETEKIFMEDDELPLTLAKFLKTAVDLNNKFNGSKFTKKGCEYCKGLNYVYNNIFFANNGKYVSQNYALKCHHNANNDNCAKMVLSEEPYNKTQCATGYALIFKSLMEREEYLKKVFENGGYDLWVNQNEVKGEQNASF